MHSVMNTSSRNYQIREIFCSIRRARVSRTSNVRNRSYNKRQSISLWNKKDSYINLKILCLSQILKYYKNFHFQPATIVEKISLIFRKAIEVQKYNSKWRMSRKRWDNINIKVSATNRPEIRLFQTFKMSSFIHNNKTKGLNMKDLSWKKRVKYKTLDFLVGILAIQQLISCLTAS